eukprot:gene20104-22075_t
MSASLPHVQYFEKVLQIEPFLSNAERIFKEEISDVSSGDSETEDEDDELEFEDEKKKTKNGYLSATYRDSFKKHGNEQGHWKEEKTKMYNFESVSDDRSWLQEILLSDNSDDSDNEIVSDRDIKEMLKDQVRRKRIHQKFLQFSEEIQEEYQHFGSSLVLDRDKYGESQKRRKKDQKVTKKKTTPDISLLKKKRLAEIDERRRRIVEEKVEKKRMQLVKENDNKRRKLWILIARKEIPKACKQRNSSRMNTVTSAKKMVQGCQKEIRKTVLRSQRVSKDFVPRAKRMVKEMLLYWKKFDKVEKEHRKKAEKEAMEQRRQDEEMREMRRQQRKLNFLITQTELYAHFMSRKMSKAGIQQTTTQDDILSKLDELTSGSSTKNVHGGFVVNTEDIDNYDPEAMKAQALINAQNAVMLQKAKTSEFDNGGGKVELSQESFDQDFSLANPTLGVNKLPQPDLFSGVLKSYQLKGMNWLANLYEQGINGILADEMGLGKTVQSIAFLSYLAEAHEIWGPFLVVAPASTLHNWQQEVTRFVPEFKVLPYWGNPSDRKSLRKFWNQNQTFINTKENAPFHVLITSYQLVVQDVRYFQRIKWQYLVLDEAQAIKSSSSVRWKILLGFNCRNRLLLTGTPIQNTMAELWALLHFIMPTLFDDHEEFNEWFSKDIESHAENKSYIDKNQLSRLHMILKPFMLRRIKKDVENELSDKIEIKLVCDMSIRQRLLYQAVKNKISIEDLVSQSASNSTTNLYTNALMNLVMQFRKVCNHPEIFERRDIKSPLRFKSTDFPMSRLVYHRGFIDRMDVSKQCFLHHKSSIWSPNYIGSSLRTSKDGSCHSCFSVTRFMNLSPSEVYKIFHSPVFRILAVSLALEQARRKQHWKAWGVTQAEKSSTFLSRRDLLLWPEAPTSQPSVAQGLVFRHLIFTSSTSTFGAHLTHRISRIPELIERRRAQLEELKLSKKHSVKSPPTSPRKKAPSQKRNEHFIHDNTQSLERLSADTIEPETRNTIPTSYPSFLFAYQENVVAPPQRFYIDDRDAAYKSYDMQFGKEHLRSVIWCGEMDSRTSKDKRALFFPLPLSGLEAATPLNGWSHVRCPDRHALITDSGKLKVLDGLLKKLKDEGHRVLIYSQMTKMIDILEIFMNFKKYRYMRLDGSSKISDRRDMVADFQSKSDIFVFLLSTRAGGLGINLTAADTVIFYDSDWNPTVDQQAMDRAHRLGQTKQVIVYRLVTRGSIEERILQRAKEKSEIQKIVISGGHFKPDSLKPKEVVSLLLDDDEMQNKYRQREAERRANEELPRKGRKRKLVNGQAQSSPKKQNAKAGLDVRSSSPVSSDIVNVTETFDGDASINTDDISVGSTDGASLLNDDSNLSAITSRPPSTVGIVIESPSPQLPASTLAAVPATTAERGHGRGRGRGRGSSRGASPRTRGSKSGTSLRGRGSKSRGGSLAAAAAAAAAAAGAAAASAAAYAAHGFSFQAAGPQYGTNSTSSK